MKLLSDYAPEALDLAFGEWGIEDPEYSDIAVEQCAAALALPWPAALLQSLEAASGNGTGGGIKTLVDEIVLKHHLYTRRALKDIRSGLDAVSGGPVWAAISETFHEVEVTLMGHLLREEQEFFPRLLALESGQNPYPSQDSLLDEVEHYNAEHAVARMTLPPLCEAAKTQVVSGGGEILAMELAGLHADLTRHTALEEAALCPLARVALAVKLGALDTVNLR